MRKALLISVLMASITSGCATYTSQVSHHVDPLNEASIAGDMVATLTRAVPPRDSSVYLYPAKDKTSTATFEQALRNAGYKVEPELSENTSPIVLLASGLKSDDFSTYCFQLSSGQICREYFNNAVPVGPFSASVDLKPIDPAEKIDKDIVGEGVVWFANERGKLGPRGTAATQQLINEFLVSGAESVQVTGISSGRSKIGNSQLAQDRAQSVAAMFFDAGVAANDIQILTVADTANNNDLPDRAAVVRFLKERNPRK